MLTLRSIVIAPSRKLMKPTAEPARTGRRHLKSTALTAAERPVSLWNLLTPQREKTSAPTRLSVRSSTIPVASHRQRPRSSLGSTDLEPFCFTSRAPLSVLRACRSVLTQEQPSRQPAPERRNECVDQYIPLSA